MSAGVYRTDQAAGNEMREDLLDIITNLDYKKTPLLSGLGKSVAEDSIHFWLTDTHPAPSSVSKAAEGADVSFSDISAVPRSSNYVQEFVEPFKVSQKVIDSNTVGGDRFNYEKSLAMVQIKRKAEYALIWGTGTSGASGSGWEMTGIKKSISTNFVSYASGSTVSETRFNDVIQKIYDANIDDDTLEAYMSMTLKRDVSSFTAGSTKNVDAMDRRLINAVDVYEADVASLVKLFAHRDIPTPSGSNGFFFVIQPRAYRVAWMHQPELKDYPASGPYKAAYWYMSITLEYLQEKAGAIGTNFRGSNQA